MTDITIQTESPSIILPGSEDAFVTIQTDATPEIVIQIDSGLYIDTGAGSGGLNWVPPQALSTWLVVHNLGRKPVINTIDPSGAVIVGEVSHLDDNVVSISFSVPMLGTAILR